MDVFKHERRCPYFGLPWLPSDSLGIKFPDARLSQQPGGVFPGPMSVPSFKSKGRGE